jgi:hypothetical protein
VQTQLVFDDVEELSLGIAAAKHSRFGPLLSSDC